VNAPEGLYPRCLAAMGLRLAVGGAATGGTAAPLARTLGRFRDYELLEEIGRGGMGVVYKARQVSLNRDVAVKMLLFGQAANLEFVKRFHTEALAAASLHHPNIVAVHEIGVHEGQHYLSMDYIEGQTLSERARDNPLPPKLAAGYLKTIAARPTSALGSALRWVKRKPVIAVLIGLVALSLGLGGAATVWEGRRTVLAREQAEEILGRLLELRQIEEFFARGDDASALARLARSLRRKPSNGLAAARVLSALTQYSLTDTRSSWQPFERRHPFTCYRLSPDGQYCVLAAYAAEGGSPKTLKLPLPVPEWFPELVEAFAGKKIDGLDVVEQVPPTSFQRLKTDVPKRPASDVWSQWAKWFLADPATGTLPSFPDVAVP
jgi:hypothetical protein